VHRREGRAGTVAVVPLTTVLIKALTKGIAAPVVIDVSASAQAGDEPVEEQLVAVARAEKLVAAAARVMGGNGEGGVGRERLWTAVDGGGGGDGGGGRGFVGGGHVEVLNVTLISCVDFPKVKKSAEKLSRNFPSL